MFCSMMVLPAFGGETTSPRWPRPIGETRSMIRAVMSSVLPVPALQFELLGGEFRRQVFKQDFALGGVR